VALGTDAGERVLVGCPYQDILGVRSSQDMLQGLQLRVQHMLAELSWQTLCPAASWGSGMQGGGSSGRRGCEGDSAGENL